jgi:hypothetical protein
MGIDLPMTRDCNETGSRCHLYDDTDKNSIQKACVILIDVMHRYGLCLLDEEMSDDDDDDDALKCSLSDDHQDANHQGLRWF